MPWGRLGWAVVHTPGAAALTSAVLICAEHEIVAFRRRIDEGEDARQ
ncbi:hypothetical protein [Mycobacterium florentinum]|nr:hypothetical protein [Mycobacterium florentinum]MCV7408178.1 hypothetical protein [Mycobacterium florentinum]BBX78585.1 hypothetical protein MFLOJ_23720 [Mycobacterium florentinum]